jgi:hypothetical protein
MEKKDKIEELDGLAQKFIIGYNPLTHEQKNILKDIRYLEAQIQVLEKTKKRMERVLAVLYGRL